MSKKAFVTSFWGDGDRGLEVMMGRMRQGKHVSEEVHALLKERAAIEEDYGKRLTKLAKSFSPREEIGTLRESLDVVRSELENSARAHLDVANEIRTQLEKPLAELLASQSATRKNHNAILEKHLKAKASMAASVLKSKERYEQKCVEHSQLMSSKMGLAPKDLEKVKAKIEKTSMQITQHDTDYMNGVEKLADIHRKWEEDMTTACKACQNLEEDRVDKIRGTVWNYANLLSSLCVSDDESCERIRTTLERCDIDRDIQLFLDQHSTGSEIPKPLSYVNYYTRTSDRPLALSGRMSESVSSFDAPQAVTEVKSETKAAGGFWNMGRLGGSSMSESASITQTNDVGARQQTISNGNGQGRMSAGAESLPSDSQFHYEPYEGVANLPVLFHVRVLYDYKAQAYEELTIDRNQVVPVFATHDDGWWEGIADENGRQRKGLFPSNFVERV
ncbi:hypothetical protein BC829DRAFT_174639 [Chytridium lagenaria]|nr:hypothetical protein BC829DRAFT_174639 [Chytridium lagenaria]